MTKYDPPALALDVDGVLLDYLGGFLPWLREQGYQVLKDSHEVDNWDLSNVIPNCTGDEMLDIIHRFSVSDGFGRLNPLPGAREAVITLRKEFPDLRIVAITSAGHTPRTEELRRANLDLCTMSLDDLTVLPLGGDKREHLSRLPDGSFFVDDLMKNIKVAESVGMPSILYRQPYNAQDDHHLVANGWDQALNILRGLLHVPFRVR